jgi:ribosome-associated toxin RatA of RatAB toxin-antitoxin module
MSPMGYETGVKYEVGDYENDEIEFRLNYEFSSKILEKIIGPVFSHISGTLVDCFIREADRLYGDD